MASEGVGWRRSGGPECCVCVGWKVRQAVCLQKDRQYDSTPVYGHCGGAGEGAGVPALCRNCSVVNLNCARIRARKPLGTYFLAGVPIPTLELSWVGL